ncbi:mucin-2, partial [Streptomyces nanshensis]
MRNFATSQDIGLRSAQCGATAVRTAPGGARAYVLLDGFGYSEEVREWTRAAARRLARTAARMADAKSGLRAEYDAYAAERSDTDDPFLPEL